MRQRFHNLLKLAAESPFAGERANALAAARRLADKHGMSLDEAARLGFEETPRAEPPPPPPRPRRDAKSAAGFFFHLSEAELLAEKARRDASLRAARARGLDADERQPKPQPARRVWRSGAKRNPYSHARVLLNETSIPFAEIAAVTGLDIYQIVGMKLKMRGT